MSSASGRQAVERHAARDVLDQLAIDLEELRIERGSVSFTELAARITQHRERSGVAPAAARVARSTVYDAFRPGRSRISPDLIAEIVRALTGDDLEAERWRARAVRDMASTRVLRSAVSPTDIGVVPSPVAQSGVALTVLIVIACFGLNNLGTQFVADFKIPLYLDMVGTAVAAVALGPWYGVAVGGASNALGSLLEGNLPGMWFVLVNVVGALVWGYGVRAWRLGWSPLRFLLLNLMTAFACSLAAVPILVFVFGGSTGHTGQDAIIPALAALGAGLWTAVFSSNILISIVDKLVSGYIALFAVWFLALYGGVQPAFGQHWLTSAGSTISGLDGRRPRKLSK